MLNSLNGLLSRKNDVPSPTVISLGQVWVDIMMDIDAIPQPGGFAVANHTMPSVGGSFRVMQAASRIGAAKSSMWRGIRRRRRTPVRRARATPVPCAH